jgi:hypothetical protein
MAINKWNITVPKFVFEKFQFIHHIYLTKNFLFIPLKNKTVVSHIVQYITYLQYSKLKILLS